MKLLTGNRVRTGDVVWWAGDRWSTRLAEAVGLEPAEGERLLAEQAAHEQVNDLALVDAEPRPGGGWRPVHIRERIRAYGPTVRPDLAREGENWR
ncbi:MAG: DUF2849 domain-containing protein [Sphingomonadaceae bacterium]|uniref:DUF2849 domain-containing protein n=1 Tax=Thermaurantiacus sp. TaxID=2820283 RepID=UPI00298EF139|nr:DUF2849 domain-containing protein [Thermaurantiacus sp.]MCS6987750.1 DUF2849 domain-containing protein [Sphingomonadaceae bacterium]MDW8415030.1 DUF2849 domain-containing protein [Thermaurantiacus sp.]